MTSRYSRLGWPLVLGAAAVLALPVPADAAPRPSAVTARERLTALNSQVDKLVDQYDKATTELAAAKKRLKALNGQLAGEQQVHDGLRTQVARLAAAAYKNGTLDSGTALLASGDPDATLSQMSAFSALSSSRYQGLKAFLDSTQRLRREQAQSRSEVDAIAARTAELKRQKATVQKAITKQQSLLRAAGVTTAPAGTGAAYDGPASGSARKALEYAYAQLGKPYIFGGTGPRGYDCSGLTMMAWKAAGVHLPRVVPDQFHAVHHVTKANLRPGDLVFFDGLGHEGIYVGGGRFIHAPHTGTVVKFETLSNPWYTAHWSGAGRP